MTILSRLTWAQWLSTFTYPAAAVMCVLHIIVCRCRATRPRDSVPHDANFLQHLALWWNRDTRWPHIGPVTRASFLALTYLHLHNHAQQLEQYRLLAPVIDDAWPTSLIYPSQTLRTVLDHFLPIAFTNTMSVLMTVSAMPVSASMHSLLGKVAAAFRMLAMLLQLLLVVTLLWADGCVAPLQQPNHVTACFLYALC